MKRRHSNENGQVALMVAIMMMTFLFFFCFVVNVGMLVNAKIQIQNAADVAAYAGAAAQARQLNTISYLNYEMRRQYKKFLFRYYVIGNMAQGAFPTTPSGNKPATPYTWKPTADNSSTPYNVPAVCIIFHSDDNYCHVATLPHIQIPAPLSFDAINDALIGQLKNLESIRQQNCGKISLSNFLVLTYWLYGAKPDADFDTGLQNVPGYASTHDIIKSLIKGLGLVPRELILRQRIDTLKTYLNDPPHHPLTTDAVAALSRSGDPHHYERSIQAFKSAYMSLGEHTFSPETIELDELQSAEQIRLNDIKTTFDAWSVYVANGDSTSGTGSPDPNSPIRDCKPSLVPLTLGGELTMGVAKDPTILTYYSVRVKAKARLLFNPWGSGGIELKAYAAAQPFGSRIGPSLTSDSWVRHAQPPQTVVAGFAGDFLTINLKGQVPDLPITPDDSPEKGWNTQEVLGEMLSKAFPTKTGNNKTITEEDFSKAYQLAMAPNLYETQFYNIPNDLEPYDSSHMFSPGIFDGTRAAVFWAPISPPENAGGADTILQSAIEDLFKTSGTAGGATVLKPTLKSQLGDYINTLRASDGNTLSTCSSAKLAAGADDSDCETFNTVRLTNPMRMRPTASGSNSDLLPLSDWLMPKEASQVLTSWNHPNDPAPDKNGRMGYSVKFVSFDSLVHKRILSDSATSTSPSNVSGSALDEDAKTDLNFIQH